MFLLGLLLSKSSSAVPFGTFDPRSLAMGGTGVASGTSANAAYYNPALMARYKTRKERGNNSSFLLPIISAKASESLETIRTVDSENLDQELVNSINTFNSDQSAQNAREVLNAATDLQSNLDDLLNGPVQGDVIVGMMLGIGHKHEGGAIIISKRAVGDGAIDNFESDIQLLEEYVSAMEFIESGGNPADAAAQFPNVVNTDGTIIDQTGNLTSAAAGSGLIITEIGMAMSKEFTVYGLDIAFGITPKIMQVITYDFFAEASTGDSQTVRDDNQDWDINMDFGVTHQIDSKWRTGIVIKNLRSLNYTTSLGNEIDINPQVRAGVSYDLGRKGLYAFDIDVFENDAVSSGSNSQVMSLGGEYPVYSYLKLRAGMTRNMKGAGDGNNVLYTVGVHWDFGGIFDLTAGASDYEKALGLQFGFWF